MDDLFTGEFNVEHLIKQIPYVYIECCESVVFSIFIIGNRFINRESVPGKVLPTYVIWIFRFVRLLKRSCYF